MVKADLLTRLEFVSRRLVGGSGETRLVMLASVRGSVTS